MPEQSFDRHSERSEESHAILGRLRQDFALKPVIATEIEFYLHGASAKFEAAEVLSIISDAYVNAGIKLASVEEERGPDQYEVALLPSSDIALLASHTEQFKSLMKEAFAPLGISADFTAKPFEDHPGSGLHVHVHLEDDAGRNVFFRDEENFSPLLLNAIGGLLALLNPCMPIFAPTQESYKRFAKNSNAPTTISWGTNNRTVAIRLPTKPMHHKHLEHRVAGSDADVAKAIAAILMGIHYGLTYKCDPGEPIYGDASLPQYNQPLIANNLQKALSYMSENNIILQIYRSQLTVG